jgi:hypothetical protein
VYCAGGRRTGRPRRAQRRRESRRPRVSSAAPHTPATDETEARVEIRTRRLQLVQGDSPGIGFETPARAALQKRLAASVRRGARHPSGSRPALEIVRANGLEIAYDRVGEGPPLVLVHGAAVDARMWQPLADEFTVVAWDEPGTGRSRGRARGFRPGGLRGLPGGADRRARSRASPYCRYLLGRHRRAGALSRPSRARRAADPHRHLRGLEGVAAGGGSGGPCRERPALVGSPRWHIGTAGRAR